MKKIQTGKLCQLRMPCGQLRVYKHTNASNGDPMERIAAQQLEEGLDNVAEVGDEICSIAARNWPHLLSKLPPEN